MGWLFAEESITGSFTHGAFTAYLVATVLILLTVRYRKKIQEHLSYRKKMLEIAEELPGLPTIPILGNAHKFRDTDRTVMILAEIGKELNATVFRVWFGPMLKIFITNPDDIEILMKKPQAAYKEHMYSFMDAAVIDTLINGSGKIYRSHKKLMVPLINGANFLPDHTKEFNRQTKIMVKNMAKYADAGEYNVEHTLVPCVADIVWETLYGEPGTSQTGAYNVFVEMSEMMLHILWKRTWAVWLWPDIIFNTSSHGRVFNRVVKVAHSAFVEMIQKKRKIHAELRKQGIEPEKVKTSMLDQIVAHDTQTGTWTTEQIRDECLTIFIGSHDTICGTAGFATLMLAMFPDIQERVREEAKNIAGDEDIVEDHLTDMTYVDMVIREVLRLFPAGPLLGRHLHGNVKLTSCTLPEGSSVLMLPMVTHRDPRYWDDPESFNPERFSPENSKGRHPYAYIPFSGGLRSCPGSKYGMHCIKILIIQMVRNYRLETKMTYDQLRLNTHLSVRCADEIKISITKLKNI